MPKTFLSCPISTFLATKLRTQSAYITLYPKKINYQHKHNRTMSIIYSSDTEDDKKPSPKLFDRRRSIHQILGGGKVADVLLWNDKRASAALLAGIAVIWFLFEVVEYNLVSLLCHIFITTMLVLFIWRTGAEIFKWRAPGIPETILDDSTFREFASISREKFNQFLSKVLYIACGNDLKLFLLTNVSLWILSVIGNYISTVNLLFFGLLCLETLPFLYYQYEEQVDNLAGRVNRQMRQTYKKFDSEFLQKIPRGPVKEKKTR